MARNSLRKGEKGYLPFQVEIEEIAETDDEADMWKKLEEDWNKANDAFRGKYALPFPDSIGARPLKLDPLNTDKGARTYPCNALHPQTRNLVPLPAFLCPIIIPEDLGQAATLLHWINCIPFAFSAKQERSGTRFVRFGRRQRGSPSRVANSSTILSGMWRGSPAAVRPACYSLSKLRYRAAAMVCHREVRRKQVCSLPTR